MPSEKPIRILGRIGGFTEDQLASMSEAQAWHHIYAHDASNSKPKFRDPEVCFTGFTDEAKVFLAERAVQAGFTVKDSVTKNLTILVAGNCGQLGLSRLPELPRAYCDQLL